MASAAEAATATALARLYDLDLVDDPGDLDLYLALAARAGGRILELGVGTGRLAVPLAGRGYRVTGVDIEPAMLARARDRAVRDGVETGALELVEGDIVGLRLPGGPVFRLAFLALNSIMLLDSRVDQQGAVRALADHLERGGIAVVDAWLPDAEDLARFDGRIVLEWPRVDPDTGAMVTKAGSAQHDAASGTVSLTTIFEEGSQGSPPARWIRTDRLRLVSADDLGAFAVDAGLDVELIAGGYDLEPLGRGGDRAVLIAVKR
jgi:SAM-dependent methyltransferase